MAVHLSSACYQKNVLTMSKKTFIGGVAVGILTTSVASYLLSTPKGQKLIDRISHFTSNVIEEVKFGFDNIDITLERLLRRGRKGLKELDLEKDFTEYDEIFS